MIQLHKLMHESDKRLLYLALCRWSHYCISLGHLILAVNPWIVHRRTSIVCYFYASSKWMDLNLLSWDTAVLLCGRCSNGKAGLVYKTVYVNGCVCWITFFSLPVFNLVLHTCQLFLFWRNSSSFRSKKENDFIMCSCFCSNLCIVMYRKFRNVPLFKFFSLICSSFWNLKVGKYGITVNVDILACVNLHPVPPFWHILGL